MCGNCHLGISYDFPGCCTTAAEIQSSIEQWSYTRTGVPIRTVAMKSEIGEALRVSLVMVKSHPDFNGIL